MGYGAVLLLGGGALGAGAMLANPKPVKDFIFGYNKEDQRKWNLVLAEEKSLYSSGKLILPSLTTLDSLITFVSHYKVGKKLEPLDTEALLNIICQEQQSLYAKRTEFLGNRALTPENLLLEQLKVFLVSITNITIDDTNREKVLIELNAVIKYIENLRRIEGFREPEKFYTLLMKIKKHLEAAQSNLYKEQQSYRCREILTELSSNIWGLQRDIYHYVYAGIDVNNAYPSIDNAVPAGGFCSELAQELKGHVTLIPKDKKNEEKRVMRSMKIELKPSNDLERELVEIGNLYLKLRFVYNVCTGYKSLGGSCNIILKRIINEYDEYVQQPVESISENLKQGLERMEEKSASNLSQLNAKIESERRNKSCCCFNTQRFYDLKKEKAATSSINHKRNNVLKVNIESGIDNCIKFLDQLRGVCTDNNLIKDFKDTSNTIQSIEDNIFMLHGSRPPSLLSNKSPALRISGTTSSSMKDSKKNVSRENGYGSDEACLSISFSPSSASPISRSSPLSTSNSRNLDDASMDENNDNSNPVASLRRRPTTSTSS